MLLLAGCSKSDIEEANASIGAENPTFYASLEGGDETRTYLDENLKMRWHNDDRITVFCGNDNNAEYAFTGKTGATAGDFQLIVENQTGTGEPVWRNYAVYPYAAATRIDNDGVISLQFPDYQQYAVRSFAPNTNVMVAVSDGLDDRFLPFKNAGGFLRLRLYGHQNVMIKSIQLQGNKQEKIAGAATVKAEHNKAPKIEMEDSATATITLLCEDGVWLSSNADDPTEFWFVLPPVDFDEGFTVTITDHLGATMTKTTTKSQKIERNMVKSMATFEVKTSFEDVLALEREALIAFYHALDGDNWKNNTNWCSDKPVGEWYGVYLSGGGVVDRLDFMFNNLSGQLPKEIGNLKNLRSLLLCYEPIYGTIPDELWNLTQLEVLVLDGVYENPNKLSGNISENISNLTNLRRLSISDHNISGEIPVALATLKNLTTINLSGTCLSGNIPNIWSGMSQLEYLHLGGNLLTGSIPNSMGALVNLNYLSLEGNGLTGSVPKSVMELPVWSTAWWSTLRQSPEKGGKISRDGLLIPAPKGRVKDIDGNYIDGDYFTENEYTIIFGFLENCPFSDLYIPKLVNLYHKYKDKGVEVISVSQQSAMSESVMRSYISRFGMNWDHHIIVGTEDSPMLDYEPYVVASPTVGVANKHGILEFVPELDDRETLDEFLAEKFGDTPDDDKPYESTDYSADGQIHVLHTATIGNGIDVVLMGDAYTDRLIADGTYATDMNKAYEALFSVEPFKSFRELFNVYSVDVVSKHEVYGVAGAETALGTWMGAFEANGSLTGIGGDHDKVFEYASKAVSSDKMNEVMVITLMNVNTYAGQCYWFDSPNAGDWGNGPSISYFPLGATDDVFAQLLHHEACGHGFAKLADEYSISDFGEISESAIATFQDQFAKGWLKNIDFTNDPAKIKWSHFLSDPRYADDGLGIYEGGHQYPYGVWRPTENSIMNDNTGGFNAPSREAIYYRIHKLAYGAEWQYDYEKFVEWDARNRAAAATRAMIYRPAKYQPTPPPVVINRSWRDAK